MGISIVWRVRNLKVTTKREPPGGTLRRNHEISNSLVYIRFESTYCLSEILAKKLYYKVGRRIQKLVSFSNA